MPGLEQIKDTSRSTMTLAVLGVLFVGGLLWGWSKATEPFPEKEQAAPCTSTLIPAGEDVAPPQVMVTVLNAGGANGLAGKAMAQLVRHGFAEGSTGNAPSTSRPAFAQVWSNDPQNPAALLLASYLGEGTRIVDEPSGYPGLTVALGKGFKNVVKGQPTVTAKADAYVCTPPLATATK